MFRFLFRIAAGTATLTFALHAQQPCLYPDAPQYCMGSSQRALADAHVTISGNTAEILDGSTTFAERTKVQVIVVQANPFKYLYQVRTKSQPLDTAIALQFLGLLNLPQNVQNVLAGSTSAPPPAGTCTNDQAAKWKDVQDRLKKLKAEHDALLPEVNKLPDLTAPYDKFQKATNGEDIPPTQVDDILRQAKALTPLPDKSDLAKRVSALIDDANKLNTDAAAVRSGDTDCDQAQLKSVTDVLTPLSNDANEMKTQLDTYAKSKTDCDAIYKQAMVVLASDSPFLRVIYPDTSSGARGITVDISRQNLRAADSKMASVGTVQITVGEAHLSISAGIGFSNIRERNIIRQASAGDTPGSTTTRFGYDKNSQFRPSAVVQLNGHLWHCPNLLGTGPGTVALSVGLVVSNRSDNTELEYLAGPSLGFLKNLVFVTAAFHAARVPQLAGGFKIGDKVPDGLQDPLPVQKNFRPGFILSITFKVR